MNLRTTFRDFYRGAIFSLSARNSIFYTSLYRYFYNPKLQSLGYFYNQLSKSLPQIRVIQVGANDGITHDPIHKFIKRDGWKGILIEPQAEVFRNKLFPLYRRNPEIFLENVAVDRENGLMNIYKIAFSNERWATGLSSFQKETIESKIENGEIDAVANHNGVTPPKNHSDYLKVEKVETKSPQFLMEKYNLQEYDVLQVDAEGFDFEIVKMFDIRNYPPKVIVYEEKHLNSSQVEEVKKYLNERGYISAKLRGDRIVVKNGFEIGERILKEMKLIAE